ncbi:pectin acetylesterase 11-like [Ipomoea triloba]|uniref:pectin acetylesterase 11-like n=1 Tax=Ipomoea triloba TaxID=35885 RepID=UPI00125D0985|nr:pectin acetylesterase 11-like [Ipomoea triloba]
MASATQLVCLFYSLICLSIALACSNDHLANVPRTLLSDNDKGAVCLDGSPPAYYLDKGEGKGSNNCWNRVYIHYCDESSFTGGVESVTNNVTYRGARIFNAIVDDLRQRGMNNAQNAILAGSSAGGLAAILHCDRFRSFLPEAARVKSLADSAIFIHDV